MGSGKRLRRSLNKYGIENHTKEILEFLNDRESLEKRESEIVNEQLLEDPLCMNLQLGGGGGFSGEDNQHKWSSSGGKSAWLNSREILIKSCKKGGNAAIKKLQESNKKNFNESNPFKGKGHTNESREKIKNNKKGKSLGETNSQYGTTWITKDSINKKIKKEEIDYYFSIGWVKGLYVSNETKEKLRNKAKQQHTKKNIPL
jgi:hypothetical protein